MFTANFVSTNNYNSIFSIVDNNISTTKFIFHSIRPVWVNKSKRKNKLLTKLNWFFLILPTVHIEVFYGHLFGKQP